MASQPATSPVTAMSDLPTTLGRYELLRPLGQGGMGRVVLAQDTILGRNVALKFLRSDLGLPPEIRSALFARMRHEARAAAALNHPNMVTLYDMGESPELGLYLVFEFIDGPTLRERLEAGSLPPNEAATLARSLGDALTEAHRAGVIHRDVKPENVLIARTGPKITDFGVARLPDSNLTQTGAVLGTPAYSAPEALASGEFSPLSDQFSLALTLYEALAGQRAFAGEDALAVATRVAMEDPKPLVELSPLGRSMARVDTVLSRALAKDPKRRYASCRDFGVAMGAALDSVTSPNPLTEYPSRASLLSMSRVSIVPRATRRVHNMVAAVALLVIVGLVLFGRRTTPARSGVSLREVASAFDSATSAKAAPPPRPKGHTAPAAPAAKTTAITPAPLARADDTGQDRDVPRDGGDAPDMAARRGVDVPTTDAGLERARDERRNAGAHSPPNDGALPRSAGTDAN